MAVSLALKDKGLSSVYGLERETETERDRERRMCLSWFWMISTVRLTYTTVVLCRAAKRHLPEVFKWLKAKLEEEKN